jgi:hypothetical protein
MNNIELQQMTFNIHKVGHHLPTDVVTLTPCSEGWVIFSDDGLEVWSETYSSASVALMRAAALVRSYEVDGGSFMSDAGFFQDAAEAFLDDEVM